jgi:hypothetical protein
MIVKFVEDFETLLRILNVLQCLNAAKSVIRNMVESLAPSGYAMDGMQHGSHVICLLADGHFIFASFASAFLLKVGLVLNFS